MNPNCISLIPHLLSPCFLLKTHWRRTSEGRNLGSSPPMSFEKEVEEPRKDFLRFTQTLVQTATGQETVFTKTQPPYHLAIISLIMVNCKLWGLYVFICDMYIFNTIIEDVTRETVLFKLLFIQGLQKVFTLLTLPTFCWVKRSIKNILVNGLH